MSSEEFNYLDEESEKVLREILNLDNVINTNYQGTAIEYLIINGYVSGASARTLSDTEPLYILTGITQKGKSYFERKKKYEKEKRKLSRREWCIAIISAIVGALIGLIPSIIQWFH